MRIEDVRLHPKQFEVFNHKSRFKVAACGRRWGKSFLSQVSLLDKAVAKPGSLNWYIAPSYKMAKQIMWDPMNMLIPRKWLVKRHETAMRFELVNGSVIELKGADKPDSLRGVGLNYVILDEMQDIKPGVWNAIVRPTLTTTKGEALFIGCVAKDTLVMPKGGAKTIESFYTGGKDKTLDSANIELYGLNREFHTADGFWNNGIVPTKIIKSKTGIELEASLPHPVLVMSDSGAPCWRSTKDLNVGDRIAVARGMNVWGDTDPGVGFSFEAIGSGFKKSSHLGEIKMTDDLAYFLGLWVAEGSFEKNGRISITCGDNTGEILESGKILGIKFKRQNKKSECFTWRASSQHLLRYMEFIGMPMLKAKDKYIPSWVFNGEKSWACNFIAGMFDGDGHVCKNGKKIEYTSASEQLVKKLQLLLLNLGIVSSYYGYDRQKYIKSSSLVQNTGMSYQLVVSKCGIDEFKNNIKLRINRKALSLYAMNSPKLVRHDNIPNQQKSINAVLAMCEDKNKRQRLFDAGVCIDAVIYNNASCSYGNLIEFLALYSEFSHTEPYKELLKNVSDNYFWDVIWDIKDSSSLTYDFTIPDTHSFWSNGFISHNTSKAKNHFYDLYKKGLEDSSGMWKSWQFPTASSPFVPAEEVERAKSDMDEKTFRMEYLCSFEDMAGKVYYPFNREIHVGEYKFNPKLPIYIGQDFNIDPMSSAIIQPQPNGEIWIIDEIVLYSSNTQEVCEEIERRYWRHMANIIMYPDPAGGARQHARGETDLDIFREKGFRKIKYRKKHPRITDRVNAVNKMLMSAKGDVLLRVNNSCKHLIKSFEQTMYQPGGREIDKDMGVEHITDALGYCVEYEFPIRRLTVSGVSI